MIGFRLSNMTNFDLGLAMNEIDRIEGIVRQVQDIEARRQLGVMVKNCRDLCTEASKEAIQCRKYGHETPKFKELSHKITESIETIEQWITFSQLLFYKGNYE